jgi:hypothetical protein
MTEPPKDQRARALERIKKLSDKRATPNRPGQDPNAPVAPKGGKRGSGTGNVGHRPQGG